MGWSCLSISVSTPNSKMGLDFLCACPLEGADYTVHVMLIQAVWSGLSDQFQSMGHSPQVEHDGNAGEQCDSVCNK